MNKYSLVLSALAFAGTQASASTLAGDTIDAYIGGAYGKTRISGFGLDAPFIVVDGTSDTKQYSTDLKLNVDGDGFELQFLEFAQFAPNATLNLVDLDFTAPNSVLAGIDIKTNLTGYTADVGPNFVRLNLGDVFVSKDKYFQAWFYTSAVPEPSTFAFLALGLGVLAAQATLRKRKQTAPISN